MKLLHHLPLIMKYANDVESQKEPAAIKALRSLFSPHAYRTCDRLLIAGLTDVDFIAYELSTGFVLLIQHKWLAPPETGDESSSNDERLKQGVAQAVKARDYLLENHDFLRTALRLDPESPIRLIEAAVICRGFEQTGFFGESDVPIVMESAFKSLLTNTADLHVLWDKLVTRPDRNESAAKARDISASFRLCGIEFVLPMLGFSSEVSRKS